MTQGQSKALETLWPSFGLESSSGEFNLSDVFGNAHPVCLEIGFGMGDSLVEQAKREPDMNFIGVEVHRPGVGHCLMQCGEGNLKNIRVFSDDSIDVLRQSIPASALDRVQVFFPDPWHKKRHHKRRLINETFLALLVSRLKPGGLVHIATDWTPYAESIQELFGKRSDFELATPPSRPETKFERRGIRLGHQVNDLAYRLSQ